MKTIIGLAGVKTSGKSTVANIIKELVSGAEEAALADKLKNVSAEAFGIERIHLDAQELKEVPFPDGPKYFDDTSVRFILKSFGIEMIEQDLLEVIDNLKDTPLETPRRIAQIVGTELLRKCGDSDIHCENVQMDGDVVIISDLRFPNEFNYFNDSTENRFIPLYIQRQEAEKVVDMNESHPSETSVFEFNHKCVMVNNNGSLEETKEQVKKLIAKSGLLS